MGTPMKVEEVRDKMMVEWSFGGLASVMGEPFKKYKEDVVYIFPLNTGDASTGTGMYKRRWPVAQLTEADMSEWDYDVVTNVYTKIRSSLSRFTEN